MSSVPRETPTPAPTGVLIPGQAFASVADAHVVFEAAAAMPTVRVIGRPVLMLDTTILLSVIVSVLAAALVGIPIAGVAVDSAVVLVVVSQQFILVSASARQQ